MKRFDDVPTCDAGQAALALRAACACQTQPPATSRLRAAKKGTLASSLLPLLLYRVQRFRGVPVEHADAERGPEHPLQRGEFVIFSFAGEARTAYPGLDGQPFFKVVRGLPGDVVTVSDRTVSVNGVVVGTAKAQAFDRRPLEPIAPTVIPPGHYYVQGTGPDSFDSRYRSSGLVRAEQVLGTVVPLF